MVASEVDEKERDNTPFVSGRAASTTSSAGRSVHSRVLFNPKNRGPSSEGLANAPATSDSISYGLGSAVRCIARRGSKATCPPGPQCETICIERTRVLKTDG